MLAYLLHAPVGAFPSPLSLRAPAAAKTPFLPSPIRPSPPRRAAGFAPAGAVGPIAASLLEGPVLVWAGRLCLYYALLHAGLAGSPRNPFLSHGNHIYSAARRARFVMSDSGRRGFDVFVVCRDRRRGRLRGQRPRVLRVGGEAPWRRLRFCVVPFKKIYLLFFINYLGLVQYNVNTV